MTMNIKDFFLGLQANIVAELTALDGQSFIKDEWSRQEGGGGISNVIENGNIFERGGVNFSHVFGQQLPPTAVAQRKELAGCPWEAMGVSLVLHPRNPYIPTVHMNVRFFTTLHPDKQKIWWFGGGMDLTPYYGFLDDVIHFHEVCRQSVSRFGQAHYPAFKEWADKYFYLKHRNEPRGVGGIFFDDFNQLPFEESFEMVQSVGNSFLKAYLPIVNRRKENIYGERERSFQAYRRGRYVEFNLIYDRGTLFGLQSGGRVESILMSLPPVVNWRYNFHPQKNSPEEVLYTEYLVHKDWLA